MFTDSRVGINYDLLWFGGHVIDDDLCFSPESTKGTFFTDNNDVIYEL
jgi:hypothetical protein